MSRTHSQLSLITLTPDMQHSSSFHLSYLVFWVALSSPCRNGVINHSSFLSDQLDDATTIVSVHPLTLGEQADN
jgi:hypothetical protein